MSESKLIINDVKQLHQAGRLEAAKQGYLALLEENPQETEALHLLGILYAEEVDLDLAQHYLERAWVLTPEDPILSLHLANVLKTKGLFSQALQILLAVTESHPHFPAAFNNLGTVYFAQGKWQEAINAYKRAIALQSDYIDAYYNLGLALNKAKFRVEALNAFSALLELAPKHVGAHFQAGCLLMQQSKYQAAAEHFILIVQEHPFHVETQTNLATCYLRLGQLNEAKLHYLQALKIAPNDTQILFNLGIISLQQAEIEEAIAFYLHAVQINPDFAEAHNNLGVAYMTLNDVQAALWHFREVARIEPHNAAIQHTITIITQEKKLSASPPEYVRTLFDSYADHYDPHLMQALHYQVPEWIFKMVQKNRDMTKVSWDILDLGCGTGLCGELFKAQAHSLVGVDLSAKMLAIAAQKNNYDQLIQADILTFLQDKSAAYDLIIAGDVLVYFGDLTTVFSSVANALKPHALFVFNTEVSMGDHYRLTPTGRFAHHKDYLSQLATQNDLIILQYQAVTLRVQNQQEVQGHLYLLQKKNI